jgi:hypothetical protein
MKNIVIGFVVAAGLAFSSVAVSAVYCSKSGEETDGQNKICYYRCPSGRAAITIKSYQLCPLSIDR